MSASAEPIAAGDTVCWVEYHTDHTDKVYTERKCGVVIEAIGFTTPLLFLVETPDRRRDFHDRAKLTKHTVHTWATQRDEFKPHGLYEACIWCHEIRDKKTRSTR